MTHRDLKIAPPFVCRSAHGQHHSKRKRERPETGASSGRTDAFCPHSVRKFFLDGCTSASFEGLEKHEAAGAKVRNELFPKKPKKVRDSVIKVGPRGAAEHFN